MKEKIVFKDEESGRPVPPKPSVPVSASQNITIASGPVMDTVQGSSHMSELSGFSGPGSFFSGSADPFFQPVSTNGNPSPAQESSDPTRTESVLLDHDSARTPSEPTPVYGTWGNGAGFSVGAPVSVPRADSVRETSHPEAPAPDYGTTSESATPPVTPDTPDKTFVAPKVAASVNRPASQKRFGLPDFPLPGKAADSGNRDLYTQGVATLRDLIAPAAIRLSPASIQVGDVFSRTMFIVAYPKYLGTNWFSPIINMDAPMDISFFIHPIDTRDIMKDLRRSATQVQSQMSIESQEGKIRDPVLESALQNIEELRDSLQQGTEKFFRFGVYMTVYASDEKALNELSQSIEAILEAQLVFSKPAILRMDQGFVATRPLGMDMLDIANNLNTAPLSTTFPFVSSDLSSNEGVLYGINRHNNSLVLFDRFKMENANMIVFAKSGAGKSYTIKLEVLRAMMFGSSVLIIDPEDEYKHLCDTVGGTYIGISLSSEAHLNPFDLPKIKGTDDDEGVFRSHIANLIGLLHLMLGAVSPEEDSVLDRSIRETYAIRDITELSDFRSLTASSFPTMTDLHAVLRNLEGGESLAARLERYTDGVFGGFLNHQTNVSMEKQMVVFNIRDLENELRPIAMYIILQFIWNEMRAETKKRMIVVDEAWIMMQNEDAAAFMFAIAKRCRKYYAGLTTITQDIGDFLSSRYGKPIITNSSIQLLLKQSPSSIDLIAETFYLTDHEKFLLLESNVGEGIFFVGTKHVAIKVIASYSEDQVITTDPRQLIEIEAAKKEFDEEQGEA